MMAMTRQVLTIGAFLSIATVMAAADRLGGSSYAAPPQNTGAGAGQGYPGGQGGGSFGGTAPGGSSSGGGFGHPSADAGVGGATPNIPETGFNCADYEFPGYYADVEAECQVFHICQEDGRHDAFLCPNNTLFQQQYLICDWAYNVDCASSDQFFDVNSQIGVVPEGGSGGNDNGFGGRNPGSLSNPSAGPPSPSTGYGAPGK